MKKLLPIIMVCMLVLGLTASHVQAATVKLNKTSTTIYTGAKTTLRVKGTSKQVTWSSSKRSVATVSENGVVTAKKAGVAIIKAKVGKKSYRCEVTVKEPYLNETELSLNVDDSEYLKMIGSDPVSWKTTDSDVATVSKKGKVTAVDIGSCTIKVTCENGKTYQCDVEVLDDTYTDTEDSYPDDTEDTEDSALAD